MDDVAEAAGGRRRGKGIGTAGGATASASDLYGAGERCASNLYGAGERCASNLRPGGGGLVRFVRGGGQDVRPICTRKGGGGELHRLARVKGRELVAQRLAWPPAPQPREFYDELKMNLFVRRARVLLGRETSLPLGQKLPKGKEFALGKVGGRK